MSTAAQLVAEPVQDSLPKIGLERPGAPGLEVFDSLKRLEESFLDKVVRVGEIPRPVRQPALAQRLSGARCRSNNCSRADLSPCCARATSSTVFARSRDVRLAGVPEPGSSVMSVPFGKLWNAEVLNGAVFAISQARNLCSC
jgi:hypothetical protein